MDRFNIVKDKEYACFNITDEEKRWEIEGIELDNLPAFEDLVNLLNEFYNLNQELYEFRLIYNSALFNEWYSNDKYEVYKSKRHYDGELCFDGDWFVVVAMLPSGQITNHYNIKDWDLFKIPEYYKVKDEFDGHSSNDVLNRLRKAIMDE